VNKIPIAVLTAIIIALVSFVGGKAISEAKYSVSFKEMEKNIQEILIATSGLPDLKEDVEDNTKRGIANSLEISAIKVAIR